MMSVSVLFLCLLLVLWVQLCGSLQTSGPGPLPNGVENHSKTRDAKEKSLSILMVTGYFPGHLYPITALGEELVKRGHNVTLCATVMEGSDLLPGLPESCGIKFVSAGFDNLTQADYDNMVREFQNASILLVRKFFSIAQWPMVKIRSKIDEIGVEQFDYIISDFSVNTVGVYYSRLGKKVMILSPLFVHMDATKPEWPSPTISTSLSDDLTFFSRLVNMIVDSILQLFQNTVFSGVVHLDEAYNRVLKGVDISAYIGIRIPFVMATAFGFGYPKTRYPLTHYVGPLMMDSFSSLEDQLVEWLSNKPNKSVIYVGFGATGFITADMAQLVIDGILATDFSAVWALPMSDQAVLEGIDVNKDRLYISKWIPRQTLFQHPTLLMTLIHCAMNSVQESLYNALPIVCVPHGFDHFDVATRVASAKVGIPLYSMMDSLRQGKVFTSENVTNAIKTITETKEYREQANKIRQIFLFAGGARRAADLVEFYAEVGYDHLIPAYAKYEWSCVQYYNLDVYCVLLLLSFLVLYCSYKLLKCCCKCCCSSSLSKPKVE